jgi:hypothetical protein
MAFDTALMALAQAIINQGLEEALGTMEGMVGNEGQQSVYDNYVVEAFTEQRSQTPVGEDWENIDIGDYMVFMGDIIEVGDDIMYDAYEEAALLVGDIF